MRFAIFSEAEAAIRANEADETSGHTMAHNMFSDMTNDEFKEMIGLMDFDASSYEGYEWPTCDSPMDSW